MIVSFPPLSSLDQVSSCHSQLSLDSNSDFSLDPLVRRLELVKFSGQFLELQVFPEALIFVSAQLEKKD
jgi:hypothetical protein